MANARQRFRFSEPEMSPKTRDNIIYLSVALSIVALILADLLCADGHGQKMWWPSKVASRAVYTTFLLAYFVARETWKATRKLSQVLAYVLLAGVVHLALVFTFSHAVGELSGISFSAFAILEMFFIFRVLMTLVRYLRSG